MVWIAVIFFVAAAALVVMTLIGPRRLFEVAMKQFRDPEAAAKVLMPSDGQFLFRSIAGWVGAVVMALGGCYALSLADGHGDNGASASEVRAATEHVAREIDGVVMSARDSGYDTPEIEGMLIRAGEHSLQVEGTGAGAGFTLTNADGDHPVCLSIDEQDTPPPSVDALPPHTGSRSISPGDIAARSKWVELSASVRAGAC
ncbi:hypothetical protein K4749_11400 [Streptomyces sp. TRM72054]|uniref:hypothetical protein n=1 Tax=Streptomyces sp. TRM72054 TaxID=2870562 RepID=UPI001C8C9897|nr:hypothetical protein [Streptomyces sp. TRM72054]MBX9394187.1 hypothetical protein [Streptomyces sp. TRM72054]